MHSITHAALSVLVLSGCVFDGSNSFNPSSRDANPEAPDATPDASPADSAGPTIDAGPVCEFYLDGVCATGDPDDGWNVTSDTSLDTDATGTRCRNFDQDGLQMCLIFVESFSVASAMTLRAIGTRPLLIASVGDILIDGTLDVSSYREEQKTGAGANHSSCTHVSDPDQDYGGAGGAAGGSFAGQGGDGGEGDVNNNGLPEGRGEPGKPGDAESQPTIVRGGCLGQRGGNEGDGAADGKGGAGGASGGALWLVAGGNVVVQSTGTLRATGAGGSGGGGQSGGGGGGSGGMILVEGVALLLNGTAYANGGGGGEGGLFDEPGNPGVDGMMSTVAAKGGETDYWGDGGEGSSAVELDGGNGIQAWAAGGGGGGAAGYILLRGSISGSGDSSPPAIEN